MMNRRFPLSGLFAVLLALMAQLGAGATVPRIDPVAGVAALCHADGGETPDQTPRHSSDCLVCPLCATLHAQAIGLLSDTPVLTPPAVMATVRAQLPPQPTAPPVAWRLPSQPRAPPIFS